MTSPLPAPLDESFRDLLEAVARDRRLVPISDPARLAPLVTSMAAAYNDERLRGVREGPNDGRLAARLGFWFPRDVAKTAAAVREMVAIGRIAIPADRPLRVLDLGAGLGASHRGLARALDDGGARGAIEVLAIDDDAAALTIAHELAKRRPREGGVELSVRTQTQRASASAARDVDLILVAQLLTELDVDRPPDDRVVRHAAFLGALLDRSPDAIVVVVEPALRPRSRHLQRVRGALIDARIDVLAPCLHQGACPLLVRDNDWCHEDLPVDLPPWLVPIAKRAGLRWEGLTFSYLVVARRETPGLAAALRATSKGALERVVSGPMVTKGKRELLICGDPQPPEGDHGPRADLGPHGLRLGRLDRARTEKNAIFDQLGRGDLIELRAPLDEKGRLGSDAELEKLEPSRPR